MSSAGMRLVRIDTDRYHSRRSLGCTDFPVMKPSTTCVVSCFLALGFISSVPNGVVLAPSVHARTSSSVELRLRRSPGRVDVVVAGLGKNVRAVSQNQLDDRWSARLTGVVFGDRPFTPKQLEIPSSELQSVRLEPQGADLLLIVKSQTGERIPTPMISSSDNSLVVSFEGLSVSDVRSSGRLDLRSPVRVSQQVMAPPMRPRAVAPPLGDMAVGTMLISNRSFVKASGPRVSLTLNNTPAKDALMSLARLGGYGFVFVGDEDTPNGVDADSSRYPVTMSFRDEHYDRALNSVLMSSGLQGRLDGNTIFVGTAVSVKSFGPQMSKVFRMNQVDVESASKYLGNLGALMNSPSKGSNSSSVTSYSSGYGPLIGLTGTADSRLNTIVLVGDPNLISVAEGYLKQIDLRKRQVAVKLQILNVDLLNDKSIDASFSARIGNTFLVSENGRAFMNFGNYKPGVARSGTGLYDGKSYSEPGSYQTDREALITAKEPQPIVLSDKDSSSTSSQKIEYADKFDSEGRPVYIDTVDPSKFSYPKNSFYGYLEAAIDSSSAKTLAQPTLLVQEGEEAEVETGTSVITSVTTTDTSNGSTQFKYERENAGLSLKVKVSKIDDNGFVSLTLNPTISVPEPAGESNGIAIFNTQGRSLSSGLVRLRDRQTLILTGVIQDQDKQVARKWPLLGDMPLIGHFFRSSDSQRQKNELVILVTPVIIDDTSGGVYGYGYKPATSASRELIQSGS